MTVQTGIFEIFAKGTTKLGEVVLYPIEINLRDHQNEPPKFENGLKTFTVEVKEKD